MDGLLETARAEGLVMVVLVVMVTAVVVGLVMIVLVVMVTAVVVGLVMIVLVVMVTAVVVGLVMIVLVVMVTAVVVGPAMIDIKGPTTVNAAVVLVGYAAMAEHLHQKPAPKAGADLPDEVQRASMRIKANTKPN